MAHYAFLDENNIVTEIITGKDENDLDTLPENLLTGKNSILTLEVRLVKELLIIH